MCTYVFEMYVCATRLICDSRMKCYTVLVVTIILDATILLRLHTAIDGFTR